MDFRKFQDMVEATMDLTKVDKFEYVVKPDFDDMLKSEYSSLRYQVNDFDSHHLKFLLMTIFVVFEISISFERKVG